MRTTIILTATLGLVGACGHDMNMSDHVSAFEDHMVALEADLEAHHARVAEVDTLADLRGEEASHEAVAGRHMTAMRDEMSDMMDDCMGDDSSPHIGAMADDVDRMAAAYDEHRARMAAAATLEAARVEESRHAASMAELFDDCAGHARSMMDEMGGMTCPHHE